MTWEEVRHQVTLSGLVTDAQTGAAVPGAIVTLSDGPAAFASWLALRAIQYGDAWAALPERPDRTRTRENGQFYFLDLPSSSYTVTAELPGGGTRYGTVQVQTRVSRSRQGAITSKSVSLALPSTALKGQVTGPTKQPIVMAEVRVQGSSESVYTDSSGAYLLVGVEVGSLTVQVSAQGFQPATASVQVGAAGSVVTTDVSLVAATS